MRAAGLLDADKGSKGVLSPHSWKGVSALIAAASQPWTRLREFALYLVLLQLNDPKMRQLVAEATQDAQVWAKAIIWMWDAEQENTTKRDAKMLLDLDLAEAATWIDEHLPPHPSPDSLTGEGPLPPAPSPSPAPPAASPSLLSDTEQRQPVFSPYGPDEYIPPALRPPAQAEDAAAESRTVRLCWLASYSTPYALRSKLPPLLGLEKIDFVQPNDALLRFSASEYARSALPMLQGRRGYRYAILDSPEDGETTATPRPQPLPPGFGPSPPTVSTQLNHIRPPRSSKTPGLPSRVYSAPPFKGAVVPPPVISSSSGSVPAMPTSPTLHNPSVVPVEPRTFVGPAPPGWRPPSPDPPARPRPPRGGDIRLHLGNLPLDITLDEVSNLFQHAGVSAQDIYLRTRSGSRSAYALVSSRAEYARASAVLHRSTLRRHKLYLERNSPRERSGAHPLVCVRGVPRGAEGKEEGHLAMLARACRCGAYGEVLDPRTGEGTFRVPSPASAQQAVDYLHGKAVQVGRIGAEWRTGEGATPDAPTRGLPSALVAAGGAPGTAPPYAAPATPSATPGTTVERLRHAQHRCLCTALGLPLRLRRLPALRAQV
ncbi:hypothetical protein JCM10450v2_005075 [Rhodotorula kratochvilovae]